MFSLKMFFDNNISLMENLFWSKREANWLKYAFKKVSNKIKKCKSKTTVAKVYEESIGLRKGLDLTK